MLVQRTLTLLVILLCCSNITVAADSGGYELYHRARFNSPIKGIYITQTTLEDKRYLQYLIRRSQEAGINTFVIDLNHVTKNYEKNILLVKNAGLSYVARIVVFPYGSDRQKMHSETYWTTRYRLVDAAIDLGADQIQLDYIRYAASNPASTRNSDDVYRVINWFKDKIGSRTDLQVDVFGESCFKESMHIGQNLVKFASTVDAVCPMLYPSHFEPYKEHAKRPYNIYYDADADADGWYAWSANNKYDRLFNVLINSR